MITVFSAGGRKFILAMTVVAVTTALTAMRVIDQSAFTSVVIAVVGAYLASNVIQKRGGPPPESTP